MPTTDNHGSRVDADPPESSGAQLVGTRVGKYEVVQIVGKGGMGTVYEAINTSIRKRVAMKCIDHELAKNEEAYERFHREALAASAIESPHIVQIFDAGKTDDGVPFIVMELLRGIDLGGYLKRVERLEVADALHITIHVLKGLHHAHTAGIVHRDLKPDNVFLVDRDDEPVFVKLLDFGVSKIARTNDVPLETLTRQGTVVGTPFYMSPEQAQAFPDVDHRTDIYSVGALLFECLAGRTPHVGKSYEQVIVSICMKDVDDVRTHNPSVPDAIAAVIDKALAREKEDRYENARDMLNALVDAAPESFRQATPSSKLRGVSIGTAEGSIAHTPMVISPAPASRVPSGLADTLHLDDSGDANPALEKSGVTAKMERPDTLPSDRAEEPEVAQAPETKKTALTEQPARSVSAPLVGSPEPQRRWALAAAPGVALLLGLALYVSFGATPASDADVASDVAAESDKAAAVSEAAPEQEAPKPAAETANAQTLVPGADADAAASASSPAASASAEMLADRAPAKPNPKQVQPQPASPPQVPATPSPPLAEPAPQKLPSPEPQKPQDPPQLELQGPG